MPCEALQSVGASRRVEVACHPGGFKSLRGVVVPYFAASEVRRFHSTHATRLRNESGESILVSRFRSSQAFAAASERTSESKGH